MGESSFKISPAYLADLNRLCKPLTQEETEALIIRARAGDVDAFKKAIEGNIRLVAKMARRFVSPQLTYDDCMSIGQMGLIFAARNYDPSRGLARFSTYACRAIWSHLHDHTMRYNTAISRPRNIFKAIIDGEVDEAGTRPVISVDAGPSRHQHRDTLAGDDDVVESAASAEL
jgi:RNA polymerase sigma factor (sigma-70 family)